MPQRLDLFAISGETLRKLPGPGFERPDKGNLAVSALVQCARGQLTARNIVRADPSRVFEGGSPEDKPFFGLLQFAEILPRIRVARRADHDRTVGLATLHIVA